MMFPLMFQGLRQMQEPVAPMSNMSRQNVRYAQLGRRTYRRVAQVPLQERRTRLSRLDPTGGQERPRIDLPFPPLQLPVSNLLVDRIPARNATSFALDASVAIP